MSYCTHCTFVFSLLQNHTFKNTNIEIFYKSYFLENEIWYDYVYPRQKCGQKCRKQPKSLKIPENRSKNWRSLSFNGFSEIILWKYDQFANM